MSKCKELYTCTFQYYIIFVKLQVIRTPTKLYVIVFVDALLFFHEKRVRHTDLDQLLPFSV